MQLFATWISTTAKLSRLNWNTQQANFLFAHSKYNCNVCEFASRSTKILIMRHFSSYFEKDNFLISISIFIFKMQKSARHMHNFCQKFKAKRKCFWTHGKIATIYGFWHKVTHQLKNLNVFPLAIHDIKLTKSIFEFIVFVISIDQSIYESLVFQSTNIKGTFYIKIMCVGPFDFLSYGIQTHLFFLPSSIVRPSLSHCCWLINFCIFKKLHDVTYICFIPEHFYKLWNEFDCEKKISSP